jgi:photosystem II stability/assembly factor-like uncharacterized protein
VVFTDRSSGTAVGAGGRILRTTNGGAKWVREWSQTENLLYGVSMWDAYTGTVVGDGGTILRTVPGTQ